MTTPLVSRSTRCQYAHDLTSITRAAAIPDCGTHHQSRVSSVLNRASKEYGKQFMLDGQEDTCWNSDQGSPQWVTLHFEQAVNVTEVQLMFQGGFVGKECEVLVATAAAAGAGSSVARFYPDDNNTLQRFAVHANGITQLKLLFHSSTDFFGRVTIYVLQVLGEVAST